MGSSSDNPKMLQSETALPSTAELQSETALPSDPTLASDPAQPSTTALRPVLFIWAIGGIVLLLVQAIARLAPIAYEPLKTDSLSQTHAALYVAWAVLNLYLEGYRGFQKKFVPRVLARAHHLATQPTPRHRVLAPVFAMAFIGAQRRAVIAAWMVTLLIIAAVVMVRSLPQPWRGLIDAGVVAGLTWGVGALVVGAWRILRGSAPSGDPQLPS